MLSLILRPDDSSPHLVASATEKADASAHSGEHLPIAQAANEWRKQLGHYGASAGAQASADSILSGASHTVIGGQQIGVGMNPVLTLYKALSLEALARRLSEEFGQTVRPVFWLQTEDHDVAEVSRFGYFGSYNQLQEIVLPQTFFENPRLNQSVGSLRLATSLVDDSIFRSALLPHTQFGDQLRELLSQSYTRGATLTEAFARFFYSCLPHTSVALFDVRADGIYSIVRPLYEKTLTEHETIENLLREKTDDIRNSGSDITVAVQEKSPLFFYHPEGEGGPRFRFVIRNGKALVPDIQLEMPIQTLTTHLSEQAGFVSSSALLRPIIQDYLFSPLAQVVGAAEAAYLKQISPLYPFFGIEEPARVLRTSAALVQTELTPLLAEDACSILWQAHSRQEFISHFETRTDEDSREVGTYLRTSYLEPLLQHIRADHVLSRLELDPAVRKTEASLHSALEWLLTRRTKYLRHIGAQEQIELERLSHMLYLGAKPQERVLSVLGLVARYGIGFLSEIEKQFNAGLANSRADTCQQSSSHSTTKGALHAE